MKMVRMKQRVFMLWSLRSSKRYLFCLCLYDLKCQTCWWSSLFSKVTLSRSVTRRAQKEGQWSINLSIASIVSGRQPCPEILSLITLTLQRSRRYDVISWLGLMSNEFSYLSLKQLDYQCQQSYKRIGRSKILVVKHKTWVGTSLSCEWACLVVKETGNTAC